MQTPRLNDTHKRKNKKDDNDCTNDVDNIVHKLTSLSGSGHDTVALTATDISDARNVPPSKARLPVAQRHLLRIRP
jgi:hypothetical protein